MLNRIVEYFWNIFIQIVYNVYHIAEAVQPMEGTLCDR